MSICFSFEEGFTEQIRRDDPTMPEYRGDATYISEVVAGGAITEGPNAAPAHREKAQPLDAALGQVRRRAALAACKNRRLVIVMPPPPPPLPDSMVIDDCLERRLALRRDSPCVISSWPRRPKAAHVTQHATQILLCAMRATPGNRAQFSRTHFSMSYPPTHL